MNLTNQHFFKKTEAELRYIIKDASECEALFRNHDAAAAAKYQEQVWDACSILASRERRAA